MTNTETQMAVIRDVLVRGQAITKVQALSRYGILHLGEVIRRIRNGIGCKQLHVHTEMVKGHSKITKKPCTYARYSSPINQKRKKK